MLRSLKRAMGTERTERLGLLIGYRTRQSGADTAPGRAADLTDDLQRRSLPADNLGLNGRRTRSPSRRGHGLCRRFAA